MLNDLMETISALPRLGEVLSVVSALLWAIALILFLISGRRVHPVALNLFKCLVGFILLIITLGATGGSLIPDVPLKSWLWLTASGVIGIGLSDTYLFHCLNLIGAGLTAVMECLYSPFVIVLSLLILGENMGALQILGSLLILIAILIVSMKKIDASIPKENLLPGIALGAISMLLLAASIIMFKPQLGGVPVLWATTVRVGSGALALGIYSAFHRERRRLLLPLLDPRNWRAMALAAFLGTYLGLIAWMIGMKLTPAVIAAPLNQLNTIFVFILAALFLNEKVTSVKIAAVILAFIGAFLSSF